MSSGVIFFIKEATALCLNTPITLIIICRIRVVTLLQRLEEEFNYLTNILTILVYRIRYHVKYLN